MLVRKEAVEELVLVPTFEVSVLDILIEVCENSVASAVVVASRKNCVLEFIDALEIE